MAALTCPPCRVIPNPQAQDPAPAARAEQPIGPTRSPSHRPPAGVIAITHPVALPPPTLRCRLGRPSRHAVITHPQVSSRACREISASPAALLRGCRPPSGVILITYPAVTARDRRPPSGVILSLSKDLAPSHTRRAAPPIRRCHPERRRRISFPGRIAPRSPPTFGCGQRSALVTGARSFDCAQDNTCVGMTPRTNAAGDVRSLDVAQDDTWRSAPSRSTLDEGARSLDCARDDTWEGLPPHTLLAGNKAMRHAPDATPGGRCRLTSCRRGTRTCDVVQEATRGCATRPWMSPARPWMTPARPWMSPARL